MEMKKLKRTFFVLMFALISVLAFGKTEVMADETPELNWEIVKYDVITSKMTIRFSVDAKEGNLAYYRAIANSSNDGLSADEMFAQSVKVGSNSVDLEMICDQYRSDNERMKRIYFFVTDETQTTYKKL